MQEMILTVDGRDLMEGKGSLDSVQEFPYCNPFLISIFPEEGLQPDFQAAEAMFQGYCSEGLVLDAYASLIWCLMVVAVSDASETERISAALRGLLIIFKSRERHIFNRFNVFDSEGNSVNYFVPGCWLAEWCQDRALLQCFSDELLRLSGGQAKLSLCCGAANEAEYRSLLVHCAVSEFEACSALEIDIIFYEAMKRWFIVRPELILDERWLEFHEQLKVFVLTGDERIRKSLLDMSRSPEDLNLVDSLDAGFNGDEMVNSDGKHADYTDADVDVPIIFKADSSDCPEIRNALNTEILEILDSSEALNGSGSARTSAFTTPTQGLVETDLGFSLDFTKEEYNRLSLLSVLREEFANDAFLARQRLNRIWREMMDESNEVNIESSEEALAEERRIEWINVVLLLDNLLKRVYSEIDAVESEATAEKMTDSNLAEDDVKT